MNGRRGDPLDQERWRRAEAAAARVRARRAEEEGLQRDRAAEAARAAREALAAGQARLDAPDELAPQEATVVRLELDQEAAVHANRHGPLAVIGWRPRRRACRACGQVFEDPPAAPPPAGGPA